MSTLEIFWPEIHESFKRVEESFAINVYFNSFKVYMGQRGFLWNFSFSFSEEELAKLS